MQDDVRDQNHGQGLIPEDKQTELWNEWIRFLTRDRFFSRVIITMPFSVICFDGRRNFRRLWLEGRAVPTTESQSRWARNVEYFLNGKDFFMNWVWPTALVGGYLLSDIIRFYAYPSWRYHNTLLDVFLGTSPNQDEAFGSQMGSDLPNEASYWYGFVLLALLPVSIGLINLVRHRFRSDPIVALSTSDLLNTLQIQNDDELGYGPRKVKNYCLNRLEHVLGNNDGARFWLNPLSEQRRMLEAAVFSILWHENMQLKAIQVKGNQLQSLIYDLPNGESILKTITDRMSEYNYPHTIASKARLVFDRIIAITNDNDTIAHLHAVRSLATLVDKLRRHPDVKRIKIKTMTTSSSQSHPEPASEHSPLLQNNESYASEDNEMAVFEKMGDPENNYRHLEYEAELSKIYNEALHQLHSLARKPYPKNGSWQSKLNWLRLVALVQYELCSIGFYPYVDNTFINRNSKLKMTLIFSLFGLSELLRNGFLLATRYRYWRFLVQKIIGAVEFLQTEDQCESKGRHYQLMGRTQENECQICPDWQQVYDPRDAQSCFNGLVRSTSNPTELSLKIETVVRQTDTLTRVDITGLNWLGWTDPELQAVTTQLSKLNSVQVFNASRAAYNNLFPQTNKMQSIASFVNSSCVSVIDFHNQGMGEAVQYIFKVLVNNNCTVNINLGSNALTDNEMVEFCNSVSSSRLTTANLSKNKITDQGIAYLKDQVVNSTLVSMNLAGNQIFQIGVNTLGGFVANNPVLRELDLSEMNFSGYDFSIFGAGLEQSTVNKLRLSSCYIAEDELASLAPFVGRLQDLDLSNNSVLSSQGARFLMQKLRDTQLNTLLFNGTPINNDVLNDIALGLNGTNVNTIGLASNQFDNTALVQFLNIAKDHGLTGLIAGNNNFNDSDVLNLVAVLKGYATISILDLSSNNISDQAGAQLVAALSGKQTRRINLANNKLGSQTAKALAQIIIEGNLVSLDISRNLIASDGFAQIGLALAKSQVTQLNIAYNLQQNDLGLLQIVENFVNPFPNRELIAKNNPPRDVLRWLNQNAHPTTELTSLDASGVNSTEPVSNALCNVLEKTKMDPVDVRFNDNPFVPSGVSCVRARLFQQNRVLRAPAGTYRAPESNGSYILGVIVPIFGIVFLCILLYKLFYPAADRIVEQHEEESEEDRAGNGLSR